MAAGPPLDPKDAARELTPGEPGVPDGGALTTKILEGLKVIVREDTRENFQRAVDPDDKPWPPLARPRPNGTTHPLIKSGDLMRASTVAGDPRHVEEISGNTLTFGTTHPLAPIHQGGATIRPQRARNLSIPITREAEKAGSPRAFGRRLFPIVKGGEARALAEATGKGAGARVVVHYLLRKVVKIPARKFIGVGTRLVGKLKAFAAKVGAKFFWGRP